MEVGVDPGSKHTGLAVFTSRAGERRSRFALQLDHRGAAIRKKMGQRSAYRRRRRTRNLRYRAPRFANRKRSEGWLAPSLLHRVATTTSWVNRFVRWAPVRAVHVERVAFDTHALSVGKPLKGIEYQHGTLAGAEVREYLLAKWKHSCAYCGRTGIPLNIEHLQPRSRGGSDRISNLAIACIECNQSKGSQLVEEFLKDKQELLAKIRTQVKAPLRDAAAAQSTRSALWRVLDAMLPTRVGSGGRTKWNRKRCGLLKSHTLDALAVGEVDTVTELASTVLVASCAGRGCHARTRTDRNGFPRLWLPRRKRFFGFATGDLVRAVVPAGKFAGTYVGRVMVRSTGRHKVTTRVGPVDTSHVNLTLLQRADGYAYTMRQEGSPRWR